MNGLEGGRPQPTLGMAEGRVDSILNTRITRRGGLKSAVGLAAGLLLPRGVEARTPVPTQAIEWDTTVPSLQSSSEADVSQYRKELRKVVRNNIETFMMPENDSLLQAQGEALKQHIEIQGYGTISTPFIDLTPEDTSPHAHYFITKQDSPDEFFPNIGVGEIINNIDGLPRYQMDISAGFFLGLTESIDDDGATNHLGYYGLTMGDSNGGDQPLTKIVLTVNYGWVKQDGSMSQDIDFLVRKQGGNLIGPVVANDGSSDLTYLNDLLPILRGSIGSLHHLQIDAASSQMGVSEIAASLGYPARYYSDQYLEAQAQTTLAAGHTLQDLVGKVAFDQKDYQFRTLVNLEPQPTPIPQATPGVAQLDINEEAGKLVDYRHYLSGGHVHLTDDEIVAVPRARGVIVVPRELLASQELGQLSGSMREFSLLGYDMLRPRRSNYINAPSGYVQAA